MLAVLKRCSLLPWDFRKELLYVGAISTGKGIHLLIDALNTIKRKGIAFNCIIAGAENSSKYYRFINNKIKKYKLENYISFTGFLQENKLSAYYNNADIFVFPSLLESYGMVLLEAMSSGLPVVAFNNSAMPYTIKDGINGLLCKNKDVGDFAYNLEKLLKDDNLYKKLSNGALQTFTHTKKMTDMYHDIDKFTQWLS